MSLSNKEVLELMEYAKKNSSKLTHITDKKNLSLQDRAKISLCRHFVRYLNVHEISMVELSKRLKLPKTRVSEMVNYKIDKFSLGQLLTNTEMLAEFCPQTRAYLAFVCDAFELPIMKVAETRMLSKQIKEVHNSLHR